MNATDFVNNYLVGKVLPESDALNMHKEGLIKFWNIVLSHIKDNIRLNINPFSFVCPPTFPIGPASLSGAGYNTGTGLNGTGGVLADKIINQLMLPNGTVSAEDLNQVKTNLTNIFNVWFAHITANATIAVSDIKTTGAIYFSGGSTPFSGTSTTPSTGVFL